MIITTYRMLFFFFFNDTATTEIYTLSLHDALPISMSSTEQEARQAQQPVTWLLVLSFVSMFAMLNDPGSAFAVTLSLIPFSAPIAMPVRWAAGTLPTSEVALSLVVLALAIVGVTWVAARIYRVGMLMTGKRPNLKELVRWVRAA